MTKQRLTVTVDGDLAAAATAAVAEGRVRSVGAWINEALADRSAKDSGLAARARALTAYEAEHGVISAEELESQERADREGAAAIRATSGRTHFAGRGAADPVRGAVARLHRVIALGPYPPSEALAAAHLLRAADLLDEIVSAHKSGSDTAAALLLRSLIETSIRGGYLAIASPLAFEQMMADSELQLRSTASGSGPWSQKMSALAADSDAAVRRSRPQGSRGLPKLPEMAAVIDSRRGLLAEDVMSTRYLYGVIYRGLSHLAVHGGLGAVGCYLSRYEGGMRINHAPQHPQPAAASLTEGMRTVGWLEKLVIPLLQRHGNRAH